MSRVANGAASSDRSAAISRRRMLRGSGALLGLPLLPSLLRGAESSAAAPAGEAGKPPVRTAFLYFPNGVWEKDWVPEKTGGDFELSPSLQPLADLKSEVLVLSGLDKKHSHGGDGHYAKTANFLTGMPVAKTTGKDISSGGISIDQLLAQHVGGQTPLPSLELGTEPVISGSTATSVTRVCTVRTFLGKRPRVRLPKRSIHEWSTSGCLAGR